MRPSVRHATGGRSSKLTRTVLRLERRVMGWPLPVGLARVLGGLGLFGASVQLLTWPLVTISPSMTSLHAALLAATVLGSVALVVTPSSTLTPANSYVLFVAAVALQTGYAIATGAIASPYLSGYIALGLVAALFASRRMTLLTLALIVLGLVVVVLADPTPNGGDVTTLVSVATICALVAPTTSLLASRQRHDLRRAERRLHRSQRESSLRRTESLIDALTGVGNRRAFDEDVMAALVDRRQNSGLLLAVLDVDGLKAVNDTFGHAAGDRALQAIAAALRLSVRAEDRLYRLGGDEFAALCTSGDRAALVARLGHYVEADVPRVGRIRASIGVAHAQPGDEPLVITSRADAALYETKRHPLTDRHGPLLTID
jgi:diguanylate cyclase (GGDEF)-like protein